MIGRDIAMLGVPLAATIFDVPPDVIIIVMLAAIYLTLRAIEDKK